MHSWTVREVHESATAPCQNLEALIQTNHSPRTDHFQKGAQSRPVQSLPFVNIGWQVCTESGEFLVRLAHGGVALLRCSASLLRLASQSRCSELHRL
jgi:hypothetical protein